MRLIRVLAAAGIAALVLLVVPGAGPALAANDATVGSPTDQAYHDAYPTLSGTVTETGNSATVTHIDLALTSEDGRTSDNATATYTGSSAAAPFSGGGANVSYSWVPKPKYNGRYTFKVTSTGSYNAGLGGTRTDGDSKTVSFNIELQPAKPTAMAAGPENSMQPTVTWNPNPEPDLAYYQVLRSYAGGTPAGGVSMQVAPSSKPTFHDDLTGKAQGQYKYSVYAVRKARTCPSGSSDEACWRGIAGPASASSAAVTVRATPATTTTSTSTTIKKSGGTGGGSTGGGSTGGGSTGGGSTGGGSTSGGTKGGTTSGGVKTFPKNTGGVAPGGNVDLSQFGSLLTGGAKTTHTTDKVDDGTYDPELKGYDNSEKPVSSDGDNSLITIGGTSVPAPSDDWVRFIGAGSLATALLVHVLWFKQQVDRIPLEAIID